MSKPELFDAHTHLQFSAYDKDREEVVRRTIDAGVWVVNVGTQIDTSLSAVKLAEEHEGFYAAVGLHPIHTHESFHDKKELGGGKGFKSRSESVTEEYKKLAEHKKVVAIGECGLDYFHLPENEDEAKQRQKEEFIKQIQLAAEVNKPLMIHCRDAFGDLIAILEENKKYLRSEKTGIAHFFTGTKEEAEKLLAMGFYFSFGGVVTITRDYDEVVSSLPIDRILLETDAPYVSPVAYRGKRNEPIYVKEVAKRLSEIRGISLADIQRTTTENAFKVFSIT
ncbi:MAG: TatD family hydrolase [Patescibacteria group bacterium]|nr:TatD family hydrolase [Patescibacteria group bacterium]